MAGDHSGVLGLEGDGLLQVVLDAQTSDRVIGTRRYLQQREIGTLQHETHLAMGRLRVQ